MTRSLVCCGHACWSLAFHYHPVGLLIFAGLVCWSIIGIARFAKNLTNREKLSISLGSGYSKQERAVSFLIGKVYNLAIIFLTVSLMIVWVGRLIRLIPWP
jgi:hypothetical protein